MLGMMKCGYYGSSVGKLLHLGKEQVCILKGLLGASLHVFVFIIVCYDLVTKEVTPNPPKQTGRGKLMCVELP